LKPISYVRRCTTDLLPEVFSQAVGGFIFGKTLIKTMCRGYLINN